MKSEIAQGETLPAPVVQDLRKLGAAVRAGRSQRGETQKALAARLQISPNTVGSAERGNPGVSAGVYAALVWAVGLPGLSSGMSEAKEVPERVRPSGKSIDDF